MTPEEKARAYDEALERAKHYQKVNGSAVISAIFPELKESEDERIRKRLIEEMRHVQREAARESCDADFEFTKSAISWFEKQKQVAAYEYWRGFKTGRSEVLGNPDMYDLQVKPNVQKPNYCRYGGEPSIEHCRYCGATCGVRQTGPIKKEQKPAEEREYFGLNDLERAIHRGFLVAGVENVPVEIIKETAQECLAQIKPSEWSREDEAFLKVAIAICNRYSHKDIADWLKALRSRPKSSDTWKPSEEQMEMLESIIKYELCSGCYARAGVLQTLYNELKKLL